MTSSDKVHPHDLGLPEPAIRRRRRSRRLGTIMLVIAALTAAGGWPLYGSSVLAAVKLRDQSPSLAIIAWGMLIVSSVTLVLGFWYLLLAQVERVARIVDAAELDQEPRDLRCARCAQLFDPGDRFCRQCGKPLEKTAG